MWPTKLKISAISDRLYANCPRTIVACTRPFNCLPMYGFALFRKWVMQGVTVNSADGSQMQRSPSYPLANLPLRSWKRHNFAGCSHINRIISLIPRPCFSQFVQNNDRPSPWKIEIKINHFRKSID